MKYSTVVPYILLTQIFAYCHSKTEVQNFTWCQTSELISSPKCFDTNFDIIFNYF